MGVWFGMRRRRNVSAPGVSCTLNGERFPIQDGSWFYEESAALHDLGRRGIGGMRRQLCLVELNFDPGGGDATHDLVLDHGDDLDDLDDGQEDGASPQGRSQADDDSHQHSRAAGDDELGSAAGHDDVRAGRRAAQADDDHDAHDHHHPGLQHHEPGVLARSADSGTRAR
jgi:hypothetical protein